MSTPHDHTLARQSDDPREHQEHDEPRRVGVAFTPFETRADVILRLGSQAEALGLDRVDLAEGWTHDSMILLAQLAARTRSIGLGTSVISAWGRTPATIALSAAGLQRCSEGRFSLGIGASSPPLTEGFHGVSWERPLTRLRYTLTAVTKLLAGERLPDPAGRARPLRLGIVPDPPIPIVRAALSPASIRLAGELADAWTPFLWARSRINDGRALLGDGESRSEGASPTRVTVGVPVALAAHDQGARQLAAWWLSIRDPDGAALSPDALETLRNGHSRQRRHRSEPRPGRSRPSGSSGGPRARSYPVRNLRTGQRVDRGLVRGRRRQRHPRASTKPPRA
ncbi:MAG: LLM class flavin-dependent oxidoreductase [Solirubrobacteraceae bacterium]